MDRKQNRLHGILAAAGLLVLVLDSRLALEGAKSGVELCLKTVVPSLFPFFVLSMMLTDSLAGWYSPLLHKTAYILGIPQNGISVLIPAFLGGYPVGAKCIGDLYRQNQIEKQEAERLLAFCSNAGPSFLFGMVSAFFPDRKAVWLLWLIHILSAVLTALALPAGKTDTGIPPKNHQEQNSAILSAAKAMALVCCWVVLFRTIITFLQKWFFWMLPGQAQVFIIGILELANGCCELQRIADISLRFVLCAGMLSFGGICVLLQTVSVTPGLSVRWYIKGKLMQTAFSLLLSCSFVAGVRFTATLWIPIFMIILLKKQKNCRNPKTLTV